MGQDRECMQDRGNRLQALNVLEAVLWMLSSKEDISLRLFFDDQVDWSPPALPLGDLRTSVRVRFVRGVTADRPVTYAVDFQGRMVGDAFCVWQAALLTATGGDHGGHSLFDFLVALWPMPKLCVLAASGLAILLDQESSLEWSPDGSAGLFNVGCSQ